MKEEVQGRRERRSKLWIAALALTILVSVIVIPPLVSINRYKSRIARAMSNSLGRPVHMSAVELRVLPRPGFVITDLTVEEDASYGAEPVLHAASVKAAIRLFSLWRGRLEISRISVDEASVNLVRTTAGRWNLDTLFRTAAQSEAAGVHQGRAVQLPYLEATNSRINVKQGFEKLPYSLVGADLSFWEEDPGDWRVRLKGQPVRTDVNIQQGDTGIVQLEGRMRRASELRTMPVHVELEWRNAQMGQLSRLLIGSDAGWRGDLTAEMKLDGTPDSAGVTARLRATGVHREEFAPAAPMDFDANCGFAYHYSARTLEKMVCDSPLGDGRIRLEGTLPGGGQPKLSLELQKIPAQAILDALRTVRQELGAGLEADGTLSGKLNYDAVAPVPVTPVKATGHGRKAANAKQLPPTVPDPFTGSITLDALRLSGGSLSEPIQIAETVFEPVAGTSGHNDVLAGTATLPAGATTPLTFTVRLTLNGYQVMARGAGTPLRVRQLAHAAGLKEAGVLDAIAGEPVMLNLAIEGPWLPAPDTSVGTGPNAGPGEADGLALPIAARAIPDRLTGTVTLRNANWKTDMLPTAVQIVQATLHLGGGAGSWDPVTFEYGPLKGSATVKLPSCSATDQPCPPTVDLEFGDLDAAELQTTLLGAEKKGTLLSTLIARFTPTSTHTWPAFHGTLKAESLVLGPMILRNFKTEVNVAAAAADITSLDANLMAGEIHISGKVENGVKPVYSLNGTFEKINASELCELFILKCTGMSFSGKGNVDMTGYTGKDLASSAKGSLHFDWKKGTITGQSPEGVPPILARFDQFSGDAEIANGAVALGENIVQQASRKGTANANISFGEPPTVTFPEPKNATSKKKE